ncbi:hypothetical protein [Agrobacterium pusense]|uniref:hypothetical protein n=1 Tax=Agrobacterium pusense TaxID=648995 RepID=UPI001F3E0305|nr:hypothetical protein [Agrobacterium pusense]
MTTSRNDAGVAVGITDILAVMADCPALNIDASGRDCKGHATLADLISGARNIYDDAIAHDHLYDVASSIIKRRPAARYVSRPMARMFKSEHNGKIGIAWRWQ